VRVREGGGGVGERDVAVAVHTPTRQSESQALGGLHLAASLEQLSASNLCMAIKGVSGPLHGAESNLQLNILSYRIHHFFLSAQ
jgi:hypothetical protein